MGNYSLSNNTNSGSNIVTVMTPQSGDVITLDRHEHKGYIITVPENGDLLFAIENSTVGDTIMMQLNYSGPVGTITWFDNLKWLHPQGSSLDHSVPPVYTGKSGYKDTFLIFCSGSNKYDILYGLDGSL